MCLFFKQIFSSTPSKHLFSFSFYHHKPDSSFYFHFHPFLGIHVFFILLSVITHTLQILLQIIIISCQIIIISAGISNSISLELPLYSSYSLFIFIFEPCNSKLIIAWKLFFKFYQSFFSLSLYIFLSQCPISSNSGHQAKNQLITRFNLVYVTTKCLVT